MINNMKIENVIYIITHPQFPGYVKIGYASDLKQRLSSLNTGTICDFEPYAVYETPKEKSDIQIHAIIKLLNPILRASKFDGGKEGQKEFFKLDPEQAFQLMEHIAIVSGTRQKLYKIDKNLKPIAGTDGTKDKTDDVEDPTPPPVVPPIKNHNIPDGLYTMETKLKKTGLVAKATLEIKGNKFVLKAGSFIAPESERNDKFKTWYRNIKVKDNVLLEDKEYESVSTPAVIVRGKSTNGWTIWKNSKGEYIEVYKDTN